MYIVGRLAVVVFGTALAYGQVIIRPVPPPQAQTWVCEDTHTAASTSYADVNAKVTLADDGDCVTIPAGGPTSWATTLTITNKSIQIVGAGIGNTIVTNATGSKLIEWTAEESCTAPCGSIGGYARLSALTINNSSCSDVHVRFNGSTANLRVDHVAFNTDACPALRIEGEYLRGVIDHITMTETVEGEFALLMLHPNWENASAYSYGDQSWVAAHTMGTDDQIVVEDITFTGSSGASINFITDDRSGTRATVRFSTINNGIFADHGTEHTRSRSPRHREYYRNNVAYDATSTTAAVFAFRGGGGRVFDNKVTGTDFTHVADYQFFPHADDRGGAPWGPCKTITATSLTRVGTTATLEAGTNIGVNANQAYMTISGVTGPTQADADNFNRTAVLATGTTGCGGFCTGTSFTYTVNNTGATTATGTIIARSAFSGYEESSGYLCLDQTGAGPGNVLFTGDGPTFGIIDNPGPANQSKEPLYQWNNFANGTLSPAFIQEPEVIGECRDIFTDRTGSFTGDCTLGSVSGVGRGLRSARPATCETGVAYWSTDGGGNWNQESAGDHASHGSNHSEGEDGGLDKCTATNTWTNDWYVPLAYPHPLAIGG